MIEDLGSAIAVITGAASGIGRSTALALASTGARLVLADLNEERLESTAEQVSATGGTALPCRCDVSKDDDVDALREAALARFGRVDIVMNNAGIVALGAPQSIPISAWQRVLDVNLLSIARSIRTFLPDMLERGSGHFVNTASTAGLWAYSADRLPYSASKAGVIALSEALALYCRPRGVGVTCLCPGPVNTNIAENVQVFGNVGAIQAPPLSMMEPDDVATMVLEAVRSDQFLVLTHPEVRQMLIDRAIDPDRFLASHVSRLEGTP